MGKQEGMQKGVPDLEVSLVQVKAALEKSFGPSEPFSMSTEYWKRYANHTASLSLLRGYRHPNLSLSP